MRYSFVSFLLTPLLASFALAKYNSIQTACECLSARFPDRVYYPASQSYEQSVNSYAYVGPRLRPNCIVGPQSVKDVSEAVKELVKYLSVVFAVRSGGHNINKGKDWSLMSAASC